MKESTKGAVLSRLVLSWSCIPDDRLIQVVFEWEAPWPRKYAIELYRGRHRVARANELPWETVHEYLSHTLDSVGGNLSMWWNKVFMRLCEEGGAAPGR